MAHAHVMTERGPQEFDLNGWSPSGRQVVSFLEALAKQIPAATVANAMRAAPGALTSAGAALRQRMADIRNASQSGGDLAALVVGGDCAQQRFCETFLRTLGLSVDVVASAEDGLTAALRSSYALIIVDERTRGFDADLWSQVLGAKANRGAPAPDIYVVVEGEGRPRGDCRPIQRPIRAVNLVRAIERLSR